MTPSCGFWLSLPAHGRGSVQFCLIKQDRRSHPFVLSGNFAVGGGELMFPDLQPMIVSRATCDLWSNCFTSISTSVKWANNSTHGADPPRLPAPFYGAPSLLPLLVTSVGVSSMIAR